MNKFLKRNVLGMPMICALCVLGVIFIGILIGSFLDFNISMALKNVTVLGTHFATYGSILSFCLYPAAGMCLFKALKKKGKNYTFLAWVLLVISFFLAVYYSSNYNGSKLRGALGNFPGVAAVEILIWILIYSWVPVLFYFILDDANPNQLIVVGVTILVAGVVGDCLNLFLKQVASRPRFKYLLTLPYPQEAFKNWWEWNPFFKAPVGVDQDMFKSWPSGNMAIAAMMFALPLLTARVKKSNKIVAYSSFAFATIYVILYGYNRIHMTNHFLSDVCFGVLFTYLIYALIDQGFGLAFKKKSK